jgi:hypothetical protein
VASKGVCARGMTRHAWQLVESCPGVRIYHPLNPGRHNTYCPNSQVSRVSIYNVVWLVRHQGRHSEARVAGAGELLFLDRDPKAQVLKS